MAIAILNISYFAGMYKSLNVVGINNFNEAFYFSVASFTTLGVGNDFPTIFKLNVALQALSGVILSATIIGCVLSYKEQNRTF